MGEICQTAGPINWHQIWHTYADLSGNEHGLKNNYPLETPWGILRGLCGKKTQAWEMWPNGWPDWHQLWCTHADSSRKGSWPKKISGGDWG